MDSNRANESASPTLKAHLPTLMMVGGIAVAGVGLLADFAGIGGPPGIGAGQMRAIQAGALLAVLGAAADMTLGRRRLRDWFRAQFPDWPTLLRFSAILLQLVLLVLVMREYQIENRAFFHNILLLTLVGFLVHHLLPAMWRMPFFLILSFAAIHGVIGTQNAAWLLGTGCALVALCFVPVAFPIRLTLVLAAAAALVAIRAEWVKTAFPAVIWPILGSMFMFRMIVFLYDLKHLKEKITWVQALSYFFLLPNVVFPLFPVVDFKTFRRSHYDAPWSEIYQRGIQWMFRGLTHLLLYRVVNSYLMISPEDVLNAGDLLRFLGANFILYLKVSGQFHIIIGMLHLFGFRLPETNHLYCLSSSFTDFWRRINIYWKDFMLKVFYYPAYFKIQKIGATSALVLATVFVFVVTWFLHAYQWFWLRGSFLLSTTDVLFWTVLGSLMVGNTLFESKFGRKRALTKAALTPRDYVMRGLRTAGTFVTIILLWSLWTSPSVSEWFALVSAAGRAPDPPHVSGNLSLLGVVAAMAIATSAGKAGPLAKLGQWSRTPVAICLFLVALYVVGSPAIYSGLQGSTRDLVGTLRASRVSQREADLLRRGYYEDLTGVNSFNNQLWDLYSRRRGEPLIQETEAGRRTGDFMTLELVPSTRIVFRGQPYTVNRWGMRDRDYEQARPADTVRLAVLGSSQVNGWGVGDHDVFDAVLEERINRERTAAPPRVEILNFAVPAYTVLQQIHVVERRVATFQANAVLYVAHPNDVNMSVNHLISVWLSGRTPPNEELVEFLKRAGIARQASRSEAQRRLKPLGQEMIAWAYRRLAATCRQRGMVPVWVYLPMEPGNSWPTEETDALPALARDAGFMVLDLRDVYAGQDLTTLQIAEWDKHPNRRGHQLIADRLYPEIRKNLQAFQVHSAGKLFIQTQ